MHRSTTRAASPSAATASRGTTRRQGRIAGLQDAALASFGGGSITGSYQALVYDVASSASAARNDADAAASVRETLSAQRQALSGVSLDEEAVTLLRYQRSYQGAARLIAAVDEMFQTILQLV